MIDSDGENVEDIFNIIDGINQNSSSSVINFIRLKMLAKSLLQYNAKETKFLLFYKLCREIEEYFIFNNIPYEKSNNQEDNEENEENCI